VKSYRISNVFFIVVLLSACEPVPPSSLMSMENGWVRAMPPGLGMTAAYGLITNHDSDTITVSSFASDSFESVSLHRTRIENGVSRMEQLPGLTLAGGASSLLEPGGLHLMLMKPSRNTLPGDKVGLTLTTSGGQQFHFYLPVEAR